MKNILLALVLLAVSSAALAAEPEILLTPGGTFYSIESVSAEDHPEISSPATRFLMFSMHQGDVVHEGVVPATMAPGTHTEAAIAYDSESKRLFVFWRHSRTLAESELLFSSLDENGQWSEPSSVDKAALRYRQNFRIGITRKTEVIDENGRHTIVPETNVHALWWDSGDYEAARYAMMTIQNGVVTSTFVSYVSELESNPVPLSPVSVEPTSDLLKSTTIVEAPGRETIELVYGDLTANNFRRLRLKPVIDVRIRIPVGVRQATVPSPKFDVTSTEEAFTLPGEGDNFVVGALGDEAVRYVTFDGTAWSEAHSLRLGKNLTKASAMTAIHRMVNTN
jgi:hypothetical protein